MTHLNRLYGILTNGDNTERRTTSTRATLSDLGVEIVRALMPSGLSGSATRALAEMYIRLCQTDDVLSALLDRVDPVNSYKLHSFEQAFNDNIDFGGIIKNIKAVGIPREENSFLFIDYVLNALYQLLETLDVTH